MDQFLDQVFFDNTIRNYLISAGIILAFLLFRRLVSRWTANLISRMVTKKKSDHQQQFRNLVLEPISFFLMIIVVIIALHRLRFPEIFRIEIYRSNVHDIIEAVGRGILIGSFVWLCNRVIVFVGALLHERALETSDRTDDQLIIFFRDFLKVIVWMLGVLLIMKYSLGFNLSNVLTGLSIVGAALALAFRESLENLIASFVIFFDRPFTIGDVVKVENVTGSIEKIGLRSTRIRTTEKTYTTVPNKKMVDSVVDNQTLRLQRNVLVKLELSLAATPVQIKQLVHIIDQVLTEREHILDWNVFFSDTGTNAHVVHVEYFVDMNLPVKQFFKLREEINLKLLEILTETRCELAAQSTDITVRKTN